MLLYHLVGWFVFLSCILIVIWNIVVDSRVEKKGEGNDDQKNNVRDLEGVG